MSVPWKDLKFMLTPSIKRIRHNEGGAPFKLNEETQKYVEVVFGIHETWIDGENSTVVNVENLIPARECNEKDFNANEEL